MSESRLVGASALSAMRALLAAFSREIRLRRDRRLLNRLDGRTLADLGIDRGGIEGAVRFGRHEREEMAAKEAEWTLWHVGACR